MPRIFYSLDLCRKTFSVGQMKVFVILKGSNLFWPTVCIASDCSEFPSTQARKKRKLKKKFKD